MGKKVWSVKSSETCPVTAGHRLLVYYFFAMLNCVSFLCEHSSGDLALSTRLTYLFAVPAVTEPRNDLLKEKREIWNSELTTDVHGTCLSHTQFQNPTAKSDGDLQFFKTEPRKARANVLGHTLQAPHLNLGLRNKRLHQAVPSR